MKVLLTSLGIILLFFSCQKQESASTLPEPDLKGAYFSWTIDSLPNLVAPGLISTAVAEYNGTFSPDGKSFYYTTSLRGRDMISFVEMKEDETWTVPSIASFSGEYIEYDPLFSPDGQRIYFSSRRPTSDTTDQRSNNWYVEKTEEGWSEPQLIELTTKGDYYNSITSDGVIYFNIWDDGDIYKATPTEGGYEVQPISAPFNEGQSVGDPFIAPDESYLIYRGYDESLGRGDMYISYLIDGEWTGGINLGEPINSSFHEMCPYVTMDGQYFIFASDRLQEEFPLGANAPVSPIIEKFQTFDNGLLNIYYWSTDFIEELRPD